MVTFTPHTMIWTTQSSEATTDPETGYSIPGAPGVEQTTPCRFHATSNKMVKNQDSTENLQVGKIRLPISSVVPHLWANVVVMDGATIVYSGLVKTRNVGQLSGGWIEV